MNSMLLDITLIPAKLAGLAALTKGMALAVLVFMVPYTIFEANVRAVSGTDRPNYTALLVRVFMTLLCLLAYNRIFSFILKVSQIMSFSILSEEQWGNFLSQYLDPPSAPSLLAPLLRPLSSLQAIILFLSSLVVVTARDVMVMLQACFLSLLYAFGPLAIICAVNEKTGQVARGWLANSIQVAAWSFFLRLVVRVWLTLYPMANSTGTGNANDFLAILTVNVSFIVLILGTPMVAARLLSGENIAALGTAAFGAIQAVSIVKTMRAGKFISGELGRFKQDDPAMQRSFFHHPMLATATRIRDQIRRRPEAGA